MGREDCGDPACVVDSPKYRQPGPVRPAVKAPQGLPASARYLLSGLGILNSPSPDLQEGLQCTPFLKKGFASFPHFIPSILFSRHMHGKRDSVFSQRSTTYCKVTLFCKRRALGIAESFVVSARTTQTLNVVFALKLHLGGSTSG